MSDYPMLISNKLHSFRNFIAQIYCKFPSNAYIYLKKSPVLCPSPINIVKKHSSKALNNTKNPP